MINAVIVTAQLYFVMHLVRTCIWFYFIIFLYSTIPFE